MQAVDPALVLPLDYSSWAVEEYIGLRDMGVYKSFRLYSRRNLASCTVRRLCLHARSYSQDCLEEEFPLYARRPGLEELTVREGQCAVVALGREAGLA